LWRGLNPPAPESSGLSKAQGRGLSTRLQGLWFMLQGFSFGFSCLAGVAGALQGYFAHNKQPPPPGATAGPHAWSCCRVLAEAVSYKRGTPVDPKRSSLLVRQARVAFSHGGLHARPFVGVFQKSILTCLSTFGDCSPQNGSRSVPKSQNRALGYPHEGPFVVGGFHSLELLRAT
jgi:hypothetical protein